MAKKQTEVESKVETYFAENPKKKVVYSTTDAFLFEVKKDATAHAKSLDEDEIATSHKNPVFIEVQEEEELTEE
ncbi:hypothetical protein R1T16_17465 [Flavobacterium sp. DG1-102-2]|uniref:hypothetical protein n=1 Tax=Flavobacterium sp. DG1-102-2 TaxID=3081663 RepID=UPI00294981B5|nr:hypothetical protein [Flavobacterium sp. DG1-102-2]MDV6170229.1 hypothetical protein [Flavobacterium sp. DG1-102-2]